MKQTDVVKEILAERELIDREVAQSISSPLSTPPVLLRHIEQHLIWAATTGTTDMAAFVRQSLVRIAALAIAGIDDIDQTKKLEE